MILTYFFLKVKLNDEIWYDVDARADIEIMNQELEPPGEFSATLAACGSSSTFFVDITDMARLDSNLMTEIVDGGIWDHFLMIWCNESSGLLLKEG